MLQIKNEVFMREDPIYQSKIASNKEQLCLLTKDEATALKSLEYQDYINHMIAETPFTIRAVRSVCEHLGLKMHNGSKDRVDLNLLQST